ncbi:protein mab-21-like 2 [Actinia tenebrosa]|uniref:Protein mab-21-like 2 n=1 Tax=Actinia tenebrosa TaxID=6105 RepID=A0A6P8HD32_ACTTE|nr:protein mab-21-like 2 [Actinia tenebrosa]
MMSDHAALKSSLDSFWKTNSKSHPTTEETIFRVMKSLLDPILVKLPDRDPVLDFDPLESSKFYQGKTSDVFEVLLCLKNFDSSELGLAIEDGKSPAGFAVPKLTDKRTVWDDFCIRSNSGKKYVSSRIFSEKLLGHLKWLMTQEIAADAQMNEFMIKINEHLSDNTVTFSLSSPTQEVYSVHVFPTIPCRDRWTFGAKMWQTEESHWPTKAMKHECMEQGFYLVGRQAPTKSPCQWQIAFLEQMKKFLEDNNGCRNECLAILKLILHSSPQLQKGVRQYHLETIILNLYKKYPKPSFWTDDKFIPRFLDAVHDLQDCIEQRKLHDFIHLDLNLMKELDKATAESCKMQIKILLEEPEKFFSALDLEQTDTSL